MNEVFIYGLTSFMLCFVVGTYFFSRIPENYFPETYKFRFDPFWYMVAFLFIGGTITYYFFPEYYDSVKDYNFIDFMLPIILGCIVYIVCLIGINWISNLLIFLMAYIITFLLPDNFMLFKDYLEPWQDRLVISFILLVISRGLGLLNGLGAISSIQFLTVMVVTVILSLLGIAPNLLCVMAMCYAGVMFAFTCLSWPPEKIVMNNDAWTGIGFILGCFALNLSVEYSETSMFIALSYLFTEVIFSLYNKYIANKFGDYLYMSTSYYVISDEGRDEHRVVCGVLKIFIINILMALTQTIAVERVALPVFSIAVNLWFLSILSGETKPDGVFSVTKFGYKMIKKAVLPSKKIENNQQVIEQVVTENDYIEEEEIVLTKPVKKKTVNKKETAKTKKTSTKKKSTTKKNSK